MDINVRILVTGKIVKLTLEENDKVLRIMEGVEKEFNISVDHQMIIYRGLHLDKERRLGDCKEFLRRAPTFLCVFSLELCKMLFEDYGGFFEVCSFEELQKSRIEGGRTNVDVQEKSNVVKEVIEAGGSNGPLIHVLKFLDPLHLLNITGVCKTFYEVVFLLISKEIVTLNENHLYILLGRGGWHISEQLFLKLCSFENIFNEDTVIRCGFPKFTKVNYNLLEICTERNFFEGLKFLIEKRGFTRLHPKLNPSNYSFMRMCLYSQGKRKDRSMDFVYYLIDHLEGFRFSSLSYTFRKLFGFVGNRTDFQSLWKRVVRLAKYGDKFIRDDLFKEYCYTLLCDRSCHEEFKLYESWMKIEPYILEPAFKNLGKLELYIGKLEWKLFHYLITDFLKKMPSSGTTTTNYTERVFKINKIMLERPEFIEFIATEYDEEKYPYLRDDLPIYKPRYLLQLACYKNDVEKVKEMLAVYEKEEDRYHHNTPFPIFDWSVEIVKLILPSIYVPHGMYFKAFIAENFEICDLIEKTCLRNSNILSRARLSGVKSAETLALEFAESNMVVGRLEAALRLFKYVEDRLKGSEESLHHLLEKSILQNVSKNEKEMMEVVLRFIFTKKKHIELVGPLFYVVRTHETAKELVKEILERIVGEIGIDGQSGIFYESFFSNCCEFGFVNIAKMVLTAKGFVGDQLHNILRVNKEKMGMFLKECGIKEYIVECKKCSKRMDLMSVEGKDDICFLRKEEGRNPTDFKNVIPSTNMIGRRSGGRGGGRERSRRRRKGHIPMYPRPRKAEKEQGEKKVECNGPYCSDCSKVVVE